MTQHNLSNQDLPFSAALFTVFLCTLFGANAVAIKYSFSGIGTFTAAGLRFSIAAAAIYFWARFTGRPFALRKGQTVQILIISLVFTLQLGLLYLGLGKTSASRGTLMVNLQPFFLLVLAHWFIPGDRMTKKKLLGLIMGAVGMVLVFSGKKGVTADVQIGDLMILVTAFLWAVNTVYTKRIIHLFSPFQIVFYPMLFCIPFFLLAGFLWDARMIVNLDGKVLSALLYQSLVTASFGFVAWSTMLLKYGAVALHSFIFIMPIAGVLLGGLILGEPITWELLLALALIVTGIVIVNFGSRRYSQIFPTRGI
ncbi:MAG: DMT family transporter [Deltaproteobacteria bacterium]|nr:DMT family transporter [Deltaproteobacteria bacterium]